MKMTNGVDENYTGNGCKRRNMVCKGNTTNLAEIMRLSCRERVKYVRNALCLWSYSTEGYTSHNLPKIDTMDFELMLCLKAC